MVFVKEESEENMSEPETWRIKQEESETCRIKHEEPETWRIKHEEPETWRIKHEEPETCRIKHEEPETCRIKHEEPETCRIKQEEQGVEEVRKKLKNLRDKYIKERRAMKEKKSGSGGADSQKVWKYFHIMTFLEPHVRERPTSSNMVENEEEQEVILTLEPVTVQIEQEVSDISTTEDSLVENENENSSQMPKQCTSVQKSQSK
ncbi:hypothetical protein G5714_003991 [Onychostoma macrolepis]|uniref:MADF domain-containing protein n=1 Tax=Onychostoma macrolepis TaxID=369639 RepID=A0A7J6DB70_9TELE|nr:hypothetical protein G5714_003991 [Onychostoma macrolepis]